MNATKILQQLHELGEAGYKKILLNHGAREPVLGVKIAELKKFQKQLKKNHALSQELFASGIYDAQYLAGLIADETKISEAELRRWLADANCPAISGSVVAWVTAESKHAHRLATAWIDSPDQQAAHAGWLTLCGWVALQPDAALDLPELKQWLKRVERTIHQERNQVRYAMNQFVISLGTYVSDMTAAAIAAAKQIGPVSVDMGPTACVVPSAVDCIAKVQTRGTIGKKKKSVRC